MTKIIIGEYVMKKDKIPLMLRLDENIHSKIKYAADKNKRSLNNQIEVILEKFLYDFEQTYGVIPVEQDDD